MAETKIIRLANAAREFNVATATIVDHLQGKGYEVANRPTTKLSSEMYSVLLKEFHKDKGMKERADQISIGNRNREEVALKKTESPLPVKKQEKKDVVVTSRLAGDGKPKPKVELVKEVPKVNPAPEAKQPEKKEAPKKEASVAPAKAEVPVEKPAPAKPKEKAAPPEEDVVKAEKAKLNGPKVVGKVDLEKPKKTEKAAPKAKAEKPAAKAPAAKTHKEEATPKKAAEKAKEGTKVKGTVKPGSPKKDKPTAPAAGDKASDEVIRPTMQTLRGPKVMGKIELPVEKKPSEDKKKRPRKRIAKTVTPGQGGGNQGGGNRGGGGGANRGGGAGAGRGPGGPGANRAGGGGAGRGPGGPGAGRTGGGPARPGGNRGRGGRDGGARKPEVELTEKEIREKIKNTMAKLSGPAKGKSARAKMRRAKRDDHATRAGEEAAQQDDTIIQVTEFISVAELASLMDVTSTQVISTCMNLGIIVSINQRLDAEVIELVSDEFGFNAEFIDITESGEDEEESEVDNPEDLIARAPIVTIMGHVDHGKTSLLDHIRQANVVDGEKGGITQHIGAYEVKVGDDGKKIAFLDTPGHEAFTAMRARGAKVTDIAVIIVAADDAVMPQTKEAISHAQAAGVPMVFAINKMDKPGANPDRIKEQLSQMNILVEDWGGKFQVQNISAKSGEGIDLLLEKIVIEAELLELKANPDKNAGGSVIEASLDKGRGYVANIMVQEGTLQVGDMMLAGAHYGKVKAMFNEHGKSMETAGPSTPLLVLGLNGAPQAGERFKVYASEQEAKEIANKRAQIQREQGIRTQKHITLDEIGRRLALGSFKELNVIVKGDVDGSVEALTDSLLKLSTEEIQVNVVHKAVGQITESDVTLAIASDAIIIGFQVRPALGARKLAESEKVEIRTYTIIYQAIEEIKAAMEGMLDAKIEEKITCNVEIQETFKISKIGTIAGCQVIDGKITRNTKIRLLRDGIIVFTGKLASLRRYKDDAKEVTAGMECGLNLEGYNDIREGDVIEGYEEIEVKRTLAGTK